jgi:DNA-binding FadR family transcriptional regulator
MVMDQSPLQHLRRQIESSSLPECTKLPAERELAEQYGVPRTVVRKALATLEAEGKIRRYVGRGTFVGKAPSERPERNFAYDWSCSPSELIELRLFLEPRLAGAAALRATPEDIESLCHCIAKFEAATDWETHQLWDITFHHAIAIAAHNSLLVRLIDVANDLRSSEDWGRLQKSTMNESRKQDVALQHRTIVEAIINRDPKLATAVMRDHLLSVDKILRDAAEDFSEESE